VRLEYSAAPGCPDEQGLRNAVAARMGYDPVSATAGRLLHVVVVREGSGFIARADLRDAAGRVLWSRPGLADADCRALVDVMGLSLKFAIDPASATAQPVSPTPATPSSPLWLAPQPAAPQGARDDPRAPGPASRPKIRLGARAAVAVGTAPMPTGVFTADVGVGWTSFSVGLEGRVDLPVMGAVADGVQLRTRIAAGSLVPCGHYGWFFGCGVVSVGALWAEGVNTLQPTTGTALYAAIGPRAGVEWGIPGLPSVALRLSLDLLVTVHPVAAQVDADHIWAAPTFAGMVGGGFVTRL
jgi:hypothetical protein